MKPTKKRSKIYSIRIYVGYGLKGAQKYLAIVHQANRQRLKVSRMMMAALKKVYPAMSL